MIRLTTPLIPFVGRADNVGDRATGQLVRYFEALATQLVSRGAISDSGSHAFGITSCSAGEGVSTVARNLAITFAQSHGRSTLLIDASGGDTDLTEVFGHRETEPVESHEEASPRARVCRTEVANLSVLTADDSVLPLSSSDSQQLRDAIDALKEDFEFVLVDMPHADELSTCFAMASAVDGVLLVVEPERVSAVDANRAKTRFQHAGANLLGVVINKERHS